MNNMHNLEKLISNLSNCKTPQYSPSASGRLLFDMELKTL